MSTALFINGIFKGVLSEILAAQAGRGGGESYLQPYSGQLIRMLKEAKPTPMDRIRLFASTSGDLSHISYTAEIIGWEDKRELSKRGRQRVLDHLKRFQSGEVNLFLGVEEVGEKAVNLITVRCLQRLDIPFHVSRLKKVSDGLPLKKRTRSGGWSRVWDPGGLVEPPHATREKHDADLTEAVRNAEMLSDAALGKRLANAAKKPEKVRVTSVEFRRNAYVIVAVRRRAKGICEQCSARAPFLRKTDGTPYLEIHHRTPLSQGGEDTVENAMALCPNCHRHLHHG